MSPPEWLIVGAASVVIVAGAKTERRTVVKITAERKSDCLDIVRRVRGCDDDDGFCAGVAVAAVEAAANL